MKFLEKQGILDQKKTKQKILISYVNEVLLTLQEKPDETGFIAIL